MQILTVDVKRGTPKFGGLTGDRAKQKTKKNSEAKIIQIFSP